MSMSNFDVLEKKVHDAVYELKKVREEKSFLIKENKRLESQCKLLEEENISARKLIGQNNILLGKQKKIKERIERLWENIVRAV